jgi:hypothetical protein
MKKIPQPKVDASWKPVEPNPNSEAKQRKVCEFHFQFRLKLKILLKSAEGQAKWQVTECKRSTQYYAAQIVC